MYTKYFIVVSFIRLTIKKKLFFQVKNFKLGIVNYLCGRLQPEFTLSGMQTEGLKSNMRETPDGNFQEK